MKNLSKYKIYLKSKKIVDVFPRKIKYFRRGKWKLISKQKKFFHKKSYEFKNFFLCKLTKGKKRFIRMKRFYKECTLTKNQLSQIFDGSLNLISLKRDILDLRTIQYSKLLKLIFIKQMYILDILLWKLSFFSTSNAALSSIKNNSILVNGIKVNSNYFLKLGDVIEFKDLSIIARLKNNLNRYKHFLRIYSFVEIDYYSCTLVIIKDYNDFIVDDFSLIFSKLLHVNHICNVVR